MIYMLPRVKPSAKLIYDHEYVPYNARTQNLTGVYFFELDNCYELECQLSPYVLSKFPLVILFDTYLTHIFVSVWP